MNIMYIVYACVAIYVMYYHKNVNFLIDKTRKLNFQETKMIKWA